MTSALLRRAPLLLLALTFNLHAGEPVKPVEAKTPKQAVNITQEEPGWRIDAGAQWRQLGSVNWQTGSVAAHSSLPWLAGRGVRNGSSAANPSGIGDHAYDDGFVNQDAGTALFGDTAYYGYNSDSQVQGNNLVYHSANGGGSTASSARAFDSSLRRSAWSDDLEGAGFFIKVESPTFLKLGPVSVSAELGYSFAQDDTGHFTRGLFRAVQSTRSTTRATSIVDTYDVTGFAMPSAPFAGTLGGSGYPIIPNAPASRTTGVGQATDSTTTAAFSSDVQEHFKLNLHTVSLGPDFNAQLGRVRTGFGLGFALNIADWDAGYDETLRSGTRVLQHFHHDASGTEALAGFYLQSAVEVRLTHRVSLYGTARYDWSQGFSSQVGPSKFSADLQGWTLGGGLSFSL